MPERAEIEAVAQALVQEWVKVANAERYTLANGWQSTGVEPEEYDPGDPPGGMMDQAILDARTAIAALDRVRDARDDDEVPRPWSDGIDNAPFPARSPQSEDHEAIAVCQNPNGEGLYVPAKDIRDGRCFEVDCDCTPRVYVPVDEGGNQ